MHGLELRIGSKGYWKLRRMAAANSLDEEGLRAKLHMTDEVRRLVTPFARQERNECPLKDHEIKPCLMTSSMAAHETDPGAMSAAAPVAAPVAGRGHEPAREPVVAAAVVDWSSSDCSDWCVYANVWSIHHSC